MIEDLIIRWKLNRPILASKMGMPIGTFNNKLSQNHSSEFTKDELLKLRAVLIELWKELDEATTIEFDEAIKTVLKAK